MAMAAIVPPVTEDWDHGPLRSWPRVAAMSEASISKEPRVEEGEEAEVEEGVKEGV